MNRSSAAALALTALALSMAAVAGSPGARGLGGVAGQGASQWSSPHGLSRPGVPARYVDVAAAGKGGAAVVWKEHRAAGDRIVASWSADGNAWSRPHVHSGRVRRHTIPQVVMHGGTAVLAWLSRKAQVMVSLHRARQGWTGPVVAAGAWRYRSELQVASNRRGDIYSGMEPARGSGS